MSLRKTMSILKPRGAFIVLEGCDRAGKTTQCRKLVEIFQNNSIETEYMNFPNRTTDTGRLIDLYLRKELDLEDREIHLLFSKNRWEVMDEMKSKLTSGISLIVDRYSFSGVAFSAAKGLSLEWCKEPETGLLKPDCVLYLNLSEEAQKERGGFGDERYEIPEMQKKVQEMFEKLKNDDYWKEIDADKESALLTEELHEIVENIIKQEKGPLKTLW